jgi:hypothetical protein
MAEVSRTSAPAVGPGAGARAGAGARPSNSANGGMVDALAPSIGAFIEGNGLTFEDYNRSFSDEGYNDDRASAERGDRGGRRVRPRSPSLNSSSNPMFAQMLETYQEGRTDPRVLPPAFPSQFNGPQGPAIRQYELNARVIAGVENQRGGSINLKL